jgi:hypothetical protein
MIVTSPDNFDKTMALHLAVVGMKSRHRKKAMSMAPGDAVVFYLTGLAVFAAAAEVASGYFEEHVRIWRSPGKPDEDYPWRIRLRNAVTPPEPARVPALDLKDRLAYVRKWPAAHWRLAFQGNVHKIPDDDAALVRASLRVAGVSSLP